MTHVKAIIWDMDGVLIDSEPHHIQAEIDTFKKHGAELTQEKDKEYLGRKFIEQFSELRDYFKLNIPLEDLMDSHRETIRKCAKEVFAIVPHVESTLKELEQKGILNALATSAEKELSDIFLNRFQLSAFFEVVITGEDVQIGKPNPECFLQAAQKLGIKPEETIVVEDSENGFRAAKNAGMLLIARKAEHNLDIDFSLADYIVEDLREIPNILNKLNSTAME